MSPVFVGSDQPYNHWKRDAELIPGPEDALRHVVTTGDSSEDVDQDHFELLVSQEDAHRIEDLLWIRTAAYVEKVGGASAGELDTVHRRHRQAGAVDHAADFSGQTDEVQAGFSCLDFVGGIFLGVAKSGKLGMLRDTVVVEDDFGIGRDQLDPGSKCQRIDLDQRAVFLAKQSIHVLCDVQSLIQKTPIGKRFRQPLAQSLGIIRLAGR